MTSVLTKKPIRSSVSARLRPAIGVPTRMSSWPLSRDSSARKAASSVMKSVAPSSRDSASSASTSRRGRSRRSCAPENVCCGGRGRSVGSASSGQRSLEAPLPVRQLRLLDVAPQPVALPDGVVGVLDRQIGDVRLRARAVRLVAAPPARREGSRWTSRPTAMWCIISTRTWDRSLSRTSFARSIASRPRSKGFPSSSARICRRRSRRSRFRHTRKVPALQRQPARRADDLKGLSVLGRERRPQGLVARHDRVEGARQRRHVELARQPERERQVVVGLARIELIEEPEALLGEGERRRPAFPPGGRWPERARPPPSRAGAAPRAGPASPAGGSRCAGRGRSSRRSGAPLRSSTVREIQGVPFRSRQTSTPAPKSISHAPEPSPTQA